MHGLGREPLAVEVVTAIAVDLQVNQARRQPARASRLRGRGVTVQGLNQAVANLNCQCLPRAGFQAVDVVGGRFGHASGP